jgi:hypothetical protein
MPSASIVDDHEIRELAIPPLGGDRQRSGPVVAIVIVVTGVATGVSGMLLGLLLHFVQHVAYGYSLDVVVSPESFLQGVTGRSAVRLQGLVGGRSTASGSRWLASRQRSARTPRARACPFLPQ